jgi:transposase
MSLYNNITILLNLKDPNISFTDDYLYEEIINSKRSLVFKGTLSYLPDHCKKCGVVFDNKIIKHGSITSRITLPKVSNLDTYLYLKKQRFICNHCNSTFMLDTPIVNENCYISNNTKYSIALEAVKKISECDIASNNNVSHSTVNRIINSFYSSLKLNHNYLPKNLCFDEFKSVKSADGAMSFIYCDADSGDIMDIVEDRKLNNLLKYFSRFTKHARNNVDNIVIDMYAPYISLIKKLFPHANIVMDKFHIVQLISRALNKTRIKIMNNDSKNYRKMKRYWRLILKYENSLDYTNYRKYTCFKNLITEKQVVEYILDQNETLKQTYRAYQSILYCIKAKDVELLKNTLENMNYEVSEYMTTAINSIKEHEEYIVNSLQTNYTNGVLEGLNNKIKVIKRIAFGYRSFYHFKARILITQGLIKIKTESNAIRI